jgi:GntR family transcriptional regulator, transcriptional repressor for pyruvate dehydrogenase complex
MSTGSKGVVPVKQLKLSDAVAAQLESLVRSGHFGTEGKFPSERDLAEQFGVGRSSMREAISKLETLGIIVRSQGIGTFVLDSSEHSQKSMSLLSAGEVTALELFNVRYAVEPDGAAMAANRRTAMDIQELKAILKEAAVPGISAKKFVKLDSEFHSLIAEATRNRLYIQIYKQIAPHHAIYSEKVILFENRMALAHQGHLQILEAIIAQDDKLAKKEAYAHLKWAEKDLAKEINKLDVKKSKTKKSK